MNNDLQWTTIIKASSNPFNIPIKEIWRYRYILSVFVTRDFKAIYKQTILGPLWTIIQPIVTTIIYIVIFGNIINVNTNGMPHIIFFMSGIIIWNYFSRSTTSISQTFISNSHIFSKVYFPRIIVPLSIITSNLLHFLIQFSIFLIFLLYYYLYTSQITITINIILLPVPIILLALFSITIGMIVASLSIKYRDLIYLFNFIIQLWMYVTPVIYPLSSVPQKFKIFIIINPLTSLFETFRFAITGKTYPNTYLLTYSTIVIILLFIISLFLFNKSERLSVDTI